MKFFPVNEMQLEENKVMSVCSGTKLKLSEKKLLLAENYQCFRLYIFFNRCMHVYENCMSIIVNKQSPLFRHQDI